MTKNHFFQINPDAPCKTLGFFLIFVAEIIGHSDKLQKQKNMSEATLTSLLEYLNGALTPSNRRWLAEHLIEKAEMEEDDALKSYTMGELNVRIDQSERDFAEGKYFTHEEVMKMLDEELELTHRYAEAV
jgi:predicted transcriptional regulator